MIDKNDIGAMYVRPNLSVSFLESTTNESQIPEEDNLPYISPTPEEFPIIAEDPFPGSFDNVLKYITNDDAIREAASDYYHDIFDKIVKSTEQCGFNAIRTGGSFQVMDEMIDTGVENGIKIIPASDYFNNNADNILNSINRYKNRKNKPAALKIMDEPQYNDWGDVFYKNSGSSPVFNNLTLGQRMLAAFYKDIMAFFTLGSPELKHVEKSPNNWIGTSGTYSNFLDVLQKLFKPGVWCYDLYPFSYKKPGQINVYQLESPCNNNTKFKEEHFYTYLEMFSAHANKTGRPFWAYCMCEGHGCFEITEVKDDNGHVTGKECHLGWYKPTPTEGMLRLEAFSALAYGAQGIVYWQYGKGYTKVEDVTVNGGFVFDDAPLTITNKNGEEEIKVDTKKLLIDNNVETTMLANLDDIILHYSEKGVWKAVKQINSEIRKYSEVFLGCELISAGHTAAPYTGAPLISGEVSGVTIMETEYIVPEDEKDDETDDDEDKNCVKGVLVTELWNNNCNYVVIVSHNPFFPVEVVCRLSGSGKFSVMIPDENDKDIVLPENRNVLIKHTLKEGGFMIIRSILFNNLNKTL